MNKLTLILLAPLSLLFVEANSSISITEEKVERFSRTDLIDTRDKAVRAREEASKSLRDRANEIYEGREASDINTTKVIKIENEDSNSSNKKV